MRNVRCQRKELISHEKLIRINWIDCHSSHFQYFCFCSSIEKCTWNRLPRAACASLFLLVSRYIERIVAKTVKYSHRIRLFIVRSRLEFGIVEFFLFFSHCFPPAAAAVSSSCRLCDARAFSLRFRFGAKHNGHDITISITLSCFVSFRLFYIDRIHFVGLFLFRLLFVRKWFALNGQFAINFRQLKIDRKLNTKWKIVDSNRNRPPPKHVWNWDFYINWNVQISMRVDWILDNEIEFQEPNRVNTKWKWNWNAMRTDTRKEAKERQSEKHLASVRKINHFRFENKTKTKRRFECDDQF